MIQKSRAIVLHAYKYGDTSLIVHCYTEKWGRRAFLVKGARKSRRNQRSNHFQSLFLLELDVYFKDNRELQWIREVAHIAHVPSFPSNIKKATQALFLSEILMKVLREEESNSSLFEFLLGSIEYFESTEKSISSFHLLFLFQLTRYLGFFPRNNFDKEHNFFDVTTGSFATAPASPEIVREKALGISWKNCFRLTYMAVDQEFNNQKIRNEFLDSMIDFYRYHFDGIGTLKSIDVLREVFN